MKPLSKKVLDAVNAAVGGTSSPIAAEFLLQASLQVIGTGAPSGAVKFQASNDPCNPVYNGATENVPTNWTDITGATVATTAGTVLIPKFDICYNWIRIVAVAGGTGTVTANLKAIGV